MNWVNITTCDFGEPHPFPERASPTILSASGQWRQEGWSGIKCCHVPQPSCYIIAWPAARIWKQNTLCMILWDMLLCEKSYLRPWVWEVVWQKPETLCTLLIDEVCSDVQLCNIGFFTTWQKLLFFSAVMYKWTDENTFHFSATLPKPPKHLKPINFLDKT